MATSTTKLDVMGLRQDFPALHPHPAEKPVVYLDSASTSLKPAQVIRTLTQFYQTSIGNVNRGIHHITHKITSDYGTARRRVASFIGADEDEIVFVKNSTEALNVIAAGCPALRDRTVLATRANHHSALLPFQQRHSLRVADVHPDGSLALADLDRKMDDSVGLICLPQVNNVMGISLPVKQVVALARDRDALVVVDAAQSAPHMPIDVKDMDADFLVFSGHKMLAPFGIGVLYAKRHLLEAMAPLLLGGGAVQSVDADQYVLRDHPARLEAGTPNIGGAIALGAAVDYLEDLGMDAVHAHGKQLTLSARRKLNTIGGLTVYGPDSPELLNSSVCFGFPGMTAHALALILANRFNIIVRSGYHCAQPFHEALNIPQTVRASFYLYNTEDEIDELCTALASISRSMVHSQY